MDPPPFLRPPPAGRRRGGAGRRPAHRVRCDPPDDRPQIPPRPMGGGYRAGPLAGRPGSSEPGPAGRSHRRRVRRQPPRGRGPNRPLQAEPPTAARISQGHGDRAVFVGGISGGAGGGFPGAAGLHPGLQSSRAGSSAGPTRDARCSARTGRPRRSIPTTPPGVCCWSRSTGSRRRRSRRSPPRPEQLRRDMPSLAHPAAARRPGLRARRGRRSRSRCRR